MKEGAFLPWGRFLNLKTFKNSSVGLWLEQAKNPSAKQQEHLPAQARAVCAVGWHEPGLSLKGAIPFSIQPSVCFPPAAALCFVPGQEAARPTLRNHYQAEKNNLKNSLGEAGFTRRDWQGPLCPGWACLVLPMESAWKREINGQGLLVF